jgi:hypothetical protein
MSLWVIRDLAGQGRRSYLSVVTPIADKRDISPFIRSPRRILSGKEVGFDEPVGETLSPTRNGSANASDLSRVVRIVVLELHRLLVAEQVGEMRPGIDPIINIEDVLPSAFFVLSELPILRHEIENRQSESPVETYDSLWS